MMRFEQIISITRSLVISQKGLSEYNDYSYKENVLKACDQQTNLS